LATGSLSRQLTAVAIKKRSQPLLAAIVQAVRRCTKLAVPTKETTCEFSREVEALRVVGNPNVDDSDRGGDVRAPVARDVSQRSDTTVVEISL
jgi:hypothetical protein